MIKATLDDKNFKDFMKQLKQTTANLAPAFDDFGKWMKKETINQFEREIDPDGKAWEPLKPSTLKRKKTPFKLRESMVMVKSMYYTATNKGFEFGLKDPKYVFHHEGTVKMPSRVVVGLTSERRKRANDFVIAQIRRVKGKRQQARKK